MSAYDAIVIGCGGVGSSALYHLARRGKRVLGIDRFLPGHDRGSSHGDTRVIRLAYMEHPDYVPLLRRAYELWEQLERDAGRRLYHEVGLLEVGPPDGSVVPGVLRAARLHGLEVEELDAAQVARRWPALRVPEGASAVFERRAGYLEVEACVRTHADLAVQAGAHLEIGAAVTGWEPDGAGVRVKTDRGTFTAGSLVISPGAWAAALLHELAVPFAVKRKALFWLAAPPGPLSETSGCPCYLYETPGGVFYGFPVRAGETAFKLAEHSGGRDVADPLTVDRALDPAELERVADFAAATLVGATREMVRHAVCLYTMSPDENFVVDRHPLYPQVAFAAGLSGHGFKFTSVLGESLAALSSQQDPAAPIGFLALARLRPGGPAMTDRSKDEIVAKKLLDEGLSHFKHGQMREAIGRLLEVVARFPHSSVADNAHYNLGMIYERMGLKEKAHNEYEAVVLFYPDSDAASFAKDRLEALEQDADPAAAVFRRAQELYRAGKFKESIHAYEELIEQFPSSMLVDNALLGLGLIHQHHGDAARAQELFQLIRTKYPDSDAARLLKQQG